MRASRGEYVHAEPAPALGILMLETRFPRLLGDAGNPATWPFPVRIRRVAGASAERVVRHNAEGLCDAFCAAAAELAAEGVDGLATTCGFLAHFNEAIAAAAGVPVAASSLLQAPLVERLLPPGRRVGVITVDAMALGPAHLAAAGLKPDTPVAGTEGGRELTRVLLGDEPRLDASLAEADMLEAGERLRSVHPEVGAIVLECANMAPYAATLRARVGLPVFDIYGFLAWFHAGLRPRRFAPHASSAFSSIAR